MSPSQTLLKNALVATTLVVGTSALGPIGCGGGGNLVTPPIGAGGTPTSASGLTAVNINLPDRSAMRTAVPDIDFKMNAYHLVVGPIDASCVGATRIDQLGDYTNSAMLTASLKQGCDYDVWLALGNHTAGTGGAQPPTSGAPTWESNVKALVDSKCVACHGAGSPQGDLTSYATAFAIKDGITSQTNAGTMPKNGTLTADEKALFQAWAAGGFLERPATGTGTGTGGTGAQHLDAVYFKNDAAVRIVRAEIDGQALLRKPVSVTVQAAGVAIGLANFNPNPNPGGGTVTGTGTDTGIVIPTSTGTGTDTGVVTPTSTATSTATATSTGGTVSIPSGKDFSVTGISGQSTTISQLFDGARYLVLDFSSSSCGYCVDDAQELNGSTSEQAYFTGGKCSYISVVPRNDLQSWVSTTGGGTAFVGQRSYQAATSNLGSIVSSLGAGFGGTPTYVLLDAQGNVVRDFSGGGGLNQLGLSEACR